MAAALYDTQGNIFVRYPTDMPITQFPPKPGQLGTHFGKGLIEIFDPVAERGEIRGALYIRSSLAPLYQRLRLYGGLAFLVLCGWLFIGFVISSNRHKRCTTRNLALAEAAKCRVH